jgi:hypothetical protein
MGRRRCVMLVLLFLSAKPQGLRQTAAIMRTK